MKRSHCVEDICVMLVVVLLLSACGTSTGTPAPSAAPSNAPSASTPSASVAPSATVAPSASLAPTVATTTTPITDVTKYIDSIINVSHDTVKSPDGKAELLIPNGALPAGKAIGDISVKPIDPTQLQVTLDGMAPNYAYQMEPDGLPFTTPVLLRITRDASPDGKAPALFLLSGGQVTTPTLVAAEVDQNGRNQTISAAISHFSDLIAFEPTQIGVKLDNPGDQPVKKPFFVHVTVSLVRDVPDNTIRSERLVTQQTWRADGPIDPQSNSSPPEEVGLQLSEYQPYSCTGPGLASITFASNFDYTAEVSIRTERGQFTGVYQTYIFRSEHVNFACLPLTPTPAATATSAATPVDSSPQPAPKLYVSVDIGNGRDGHDTFGRALLSPQGDKSEVLLQVKMDPGAALPAFIQQGGCPNPGASQYPLTTVLTGTSTTLVDASLASLLSGEYAINMQQSSSQPNVYVACGNIPKGVLITLGAGRAGDPSPGMMALLSVAARTEFHIAMQPAAPGIQQSANIQEGSCANLGSVKYPLGTLNRGTLSGTINVALADLLKGGYVINVQKSATEPGVSVACAALK